MIKKTGRLVVAAGALGLIVGAAGSALANGNRGGHFGGGGHVGGGAHVGGGGAAHVGAAHYGGVAHYGGPAHFAAGRAYAPGTGSRVAASQHYPAANHGYSNRSAGARWSGDGDGDGDGYRGWAGTYWGGGYWNNGWWPAAYYGVGFSWFLPILPAIYATYWWDGIPYYYMDDIYYTWNPSYDGYVATDPPPVADNSSAGAATQPADAGANDAGQVYMYPENGQSAEQQTADRGACEDWAASQTSGEGSAQADSDYRRAMIACAEGRGYSAH